MIVIINKQTYRTFDGLMSERTLLLGEEIIQLRKESEMYRKLL
jgi:hypothetical protein